LDAREALIKHNLRLVVFIANKYRNSDIPFMDLVQEGNLGLIKAADRFDWSKGFRFSTYATWWIKSAILKCLEGSSRSIKWKNTVSLYAPVGEDEESVLGDFEEDFETSRPEDAAVSSVLAKQLYDVMDSLSPYEKKVVKMRYGFDDSDCKTLEQIGRELKITREGVRMLENKALDRLRDMIGVDDYNAA